MSATTDFPTTQDNFLTVDDPIQKEMKIMSAVVATEACLMLSGATTPAQVLAALQGAVTSGIAKPSLALSITSGAGGALDASKGLNVVTVHDNTAFLLSNPLTPVNGALLGVVIVNASGGTLGTITWGNKFVTPVPSFAKPANTASVGLLFQYDGTIWRQLTGSVFNPQSAITALTDNSGGATGDGTIAVVTLPDTLTDSTGGTPGTTLAVVTIPTLTDWNGSSVYPSAAEATAINAALTSLKNTVSGLAAQQAKDKTAITACRDAVKELSTQIQLLNAAMLAAGVTA